MTLETIEYRDVLPISDGGLGTLPGSETSFSLMAEVEALKPGRKLEAAQTRLEQSYRVKHWTDKRYTPTVGSTIYVRGKACTIQGMAETDAALNRVVLTATQQASGTVSN